MNKKLLLIVSILILSSAQSVLAAYEPTNLTADTITSSSIKWTWTANDTYYNTTVRIDGVLVSNVTTPVTGTQLYTATGLAKNTDYTISLRSANNTAYNTTTAYSGWTNLTTTSGNIFTGVADVLSATVSIMPSIIDLVVAIVPVLVALAVVGLVTGIFQAIIAAIRGGL